MTSIGRYQIIRQLGAGGMAAVYLARDPLLERDVAIKVPGSGQISPHLLERFMVEAKAVARLEHPAIVPLYDFGEHDGRPYLVMRYMSGGSLENRIARQPLSLAEAIAVTSRIADALDFAHAQGIIHRDVKPGNILFDDTGTAYLSDFGIARLMDLASGFALTGSGVVIGTMAYMSPEQIIGKPADGRSDIYALTTVVFEMLAGELPFKAGSGMEQALQMVHAPIPSILSRRRDLPSPTQQVIANGLAKQPGDRYQTASALAADLRGIAAGRPSRTPRSTSKKGGGIPSWLWAGALAVAALVLGAIIVTNGNRPTTASQQPTGFVQPSTSAVTLVGGETPGIDDDPTPGGEQIVSNVGPTSTLPAAVPTDPPLSSTLIPIPVPMAGVSRIVRLPGEVNIQQVFVPAGEFLMGSNDDPFAKGNESPQHVVYVDSFWLDKTEVSNAQFAAFVEDTGFRTTAEQTGTGRVRVETGWITVEGVNWRNPADPDDKVIQEWPVVQVSWDDAEAYCGWAGGRLPTEAEWEYAARGSIGQRYSWGENFNGEKVNYCDHNCPLSWADNNVDDGYGTIAPVDSFPNGVSWIGAYNLIGNVWEWTYDWYANGYYATSPYANPTGPPTGDFRVLRGGAWYNLSETMRPAERGYDRPSDHDNGAGFRCAGSLDEDSSITLSPDVLGVTSAPAVSAGLTLDAFNYTGSGPLNAVYRINAPGNDLSLALVASPAGGQALGLQYDIHNGPPTDYVGVESDRQAMDWRGYREVCLWLQNDGFGGHLVFQFRERSATTWKAVVPLSGLMTGTVCLPLDLRTFQNNSGTADTMLDLSAIDNFAIYLGGSQGKGIVLVDSIELVP